MSKWPYCLIDERVIKDMPHIVFYEVLRFIVFPRMGHFNRKEPIAIPFWYKIININNQWICYKLG